MKKQRNYIGQGSFIRPCLYAFISLVLLLTGNKSIAQTTRQFKDTTITTSATYTYNTIRILPNTTITPSTGQSIRFVAPAAGGIPLNNALSSAQNYILTAIPRIPGYVPGQSGYTSSDVMQVVQYADGLGRPLQTVQIKGAPNADKDLVQPFAYDAYGREAIKYLPYAAPGTDGSYKADALNTGAGLQNFYNPGGNGASGAQQANGVVVNPAPYGQTVFEPSPLNRVTEQGAPGTPWQPGSGHTTRTVYAANDAATYPAKRYDVSIDGTTGARTLSTPGNYDVNQLYVTVMMDENWSSGKPGTMEEYKNKEDRVVLKRTYDDSGTALSTYYVYDDLGDLAFVLTPGSNADSAQPDQATLDNLCYQYRYDERNRVSQKKLPGKGWEYVVYNKLDQVVMTQDANQRSSNQWTVTKYDGDGRDIITGLWNAGNAIALSSLQASIYAAAQWDVKDATANITSYPTGYVISSYPAISIILMVNYYDSYSGIPGLPASYSNPSGSMTLPIGLLTASKTSVLNTINNAQSDVLWTVNYYDDKGRNMAAYQQHYLNANANTGNYDLLTTAYNFSNEIISTNRQHYTAAGGSPALTLTNTYVYDHMGRKTKSYEQINGGANVLLSQADYNDIGQLKTKHLGNDIQQIAYTYNERGWLKTSSAPLFAMQLNYNDGTAPQYNGNIANQYWGTPGSLNKSYTYSYDKLNRLTSGVSNESFNETISYDVMGNITQLSRNPMGTNNYNYTGNQLSSITGFVNGSFGYDGNGNQTQDNTKGITIDYNLLNLPKSISKPSTGETMTNQWLANGTKIKKTIGSLTRDYVGGIEYNNGQIEFIATEEGRAVPAGGGTYTYDYYLKDHLGNNRLQLKQDGTVLETSDYYPFGLQVQRAGSTVASPPQNYKYNGKELQQELGLMQLDYGARFYDPVIGRFNTIDPLAEKDRRWSSYSYGHNNPISHIDVDGMFDWVKDQDGDIKWDKNAKSQATTKEGETYLGKDLKFTFNSYINNTFDGPNPPWGATGDKLTSTINLTSQQDADGNLTSVSVKSSYDVAATGGLSMFKGRNFFPGLGDDQNKAINISNSTGFNATFEQHASVPGLEAAGLALLGYSAVNVAQKLTLGLSGNNLSVSAGTDVFPSATLSVNGNQLFQYNQPSFKATHGNSLIDFGSSTRSPSIIHRPAPNFYNRYNSN